MLAESDFVAADPRAARAGLDGRTIHVWRLPYRRTLQREPLRALLAAYLDCATERVRFDDDVHGKPHLAGAHRDALQFSWSHGGDLALVALARGVDVGVDVERTATRTRALELAQRFFDPDEAVALAAHTDAARNAAFLRLWCVKEAVLKALGRGIAFGLERIVFAEAGENWVPQRFAPEAGLATEWRVHALTPAAGYAGALAWRGAMRRVRIFATDGFA